MGRRGPWAAKSVVGFNNWKQLIYNEEIWNNWLKDKNVEQTYWTSHDVVQCPGEGEKEEGEADRKEERCKKGIFQSATRF